MLGPDGNLAIELVRGLDIRHYRINPAWAHLERDGTDKDHLWASGLQSLTL